MYIIFDYKRAFFQIGLGSFSDAGMKAGIYVPPSDQHGEHEFQRGGRFQTFNTGWAWHRLNLDTHKNPTPHNSHLRFSVRGSENIQKLFLFFKKCSEFFQKIFSHKLESQKKIILGLRVLSILISLFRFVAPSAEIPIFKGDENEAYKIEELNSSEFFKLIDMETKALDISIQSSRHSQGEIPKLAGMTQYRFLPLDSEKSKSLVGQEFLLLAPVNSFMRMERESLSTHIENPQLICDGVGVFLLKKKNLLLVSEKNLITPKARPHYVIFPIDSHTFKSYSFAKKCSELPINFKDTYVFL